MSKIDFQEKKDQENVHFLKYFILSLNSQHLLKNNIPVLTAELNPLTPVTLKGHILSHENKKALSSFYHKKYF